MSLAHLIHTLTGIITRETRRISHGKLARSAVTFQHHLLSRKTTIMDIGAGLEVVTEAVAAGGLVIEIVKVTATGFSTTLAAPVGRTVEGVGRGARPGIDTEAAVGEM
jgi:hypothetical protein